MTIPEPILIPHHFPMPPLRCCICRKTVQEALGLRYGPICRPCLQKYADSGQIDDLSALLCAEILTDDSTHQEVFP